MTTPEFGFTAWGFDLVRIAEPVTATGPNTAAPRARMIARNRGVTLETDGRQVTARVHSGSRASLAHLEFAPMDAATAVALRAALGNRPEPDDAAHAALLAAGLRPAPALEASDCSCRGRSAMCLHVLAALYALAALVDHAPATVLAIQSVGGTESPAADAGEDRPVPRWTPLASLHARDFYALSGT